ncbi:hypothetical protein WJX81_007381 [Elliptochloris bilobata]|uniref:Uncharacterized protein n=1 Tax=Elliptochloris bilobata TaxID=381761 RepID=A0AAW1SI80_9CHLO
MAFNVLTQKMSVLTPGAPALRVSLPSRHMRARAPFTVCSAAKRTEDDRSIASKLAVPFTGALAAAMLLGAAVPQDALAARSGGRVGGSSFRSSAPSRSMAPQSGGGGGGGGGGGATVRNYNYYGGPSYSPPLIGGYGYGGYGGGLFAPSFALPVFGFGGFFNFIFFMFAVSAVLGVARSLLSRRNDDFDD